MKNLFLFPILIFCVVLFGCAGNPLKQTIHFKPLSADQFNSAADSSYAIPQGKVWDERRRTHDSCMGESFAANAIFVRTRDTIRLGSIVNMQTMKVVKELDPRNIQGLFSSAFSFMTKPCYEKRRLDISTASFLNKEIKLRIPSADKKINDEINQALNSSIYTEIETGSWVNIELTDAIGRILDTTTNVELISYKTYLLDSTNMILVKSSSITDINFYITTKQPMSAALLKVLSQKPLVQIENSDFKAQLFYLNNNSFHLKFSGIFQVMGQFMQCKLE
ncbi:MAG: hypothetical protein ABI861_13470 [Panacibacter sp.]